MKCCENTSFIIVHLLCYATAAPRAGVIMNLQSTVCVMHQ